MNASHALTLRALAALLAYPDEELRDALPEVGAALAADRRLGTACQAALAGLVAEIGAGELLDAEARYVELFDRGRGTSLNLFEHVHGDGRMRGPAMLELRERYRAAGLEQAGNELPDHLPVLLEYLSCAPEEESHLLLGECAPILRKLGNTLARRGSHYAAVAAALLELADCEGLDPAAPVPPAEDLDRSWAEPPVFASPTAAAP